MVITKEQKNRIEEYRKKIKPNIEYTESGRPIKHYQIMCKGERNAINNILSQIDLRASFEVDIVEIQMILKEHQIYNKKHYHHMDLKVNDGFLYIDGEPKGWIAPSTPKRIGYTPYGYYIEGKILARQGL